MSTQLEKINQFLKKHLMHPENIDFAACMAACLSDMDAGLNGNRVSFDMLPCYVSMGAEVKKAEQKVLVLDAGGTNFRISVAEWNDNDEISVQLLFKSMMPGVEKSVDVDEMFEIFAQRSLPYLSDIQKIGFCFSYAMDMEEDGDGKIKFLCKAIKIENATGKKIGKGLKNAILKNGNGERKEIKVVNDSVAVTLAMKTIPDYKKYGGYIGMIIGTGFNICYVEKLSNIKTAHPDFYRESEMLINMESDKFFKMTRGTFDIEYDQCSGDFGHPTMKMITGAYLGNLCNLVLSGAAREGLFTDETNKRLMNVDNLKTEEISEFIDNPNGNSLLASCCVDRKDAEMVDEILLLVIERGAKLVAAILAAVIQKSYCFRPGQLICICAEGTTIQKVPTMKDRICSYLREFTDAHGYAFDMIHIPDATVKGSAITALQ